MYSNLSSFSFVFFVLFNKSFPNPQTHSLVLRARSSHTDVCDVPCECVALRVIPLSPPLHYHLWHEARMPVYRAVCSGFVLLPWCQFHIALIMLSLSVVVWYGKSPPCFSLGVPGLLMALSTSTYSRISFSISTPQGETYWNSDWEFIASDHLGELASLQLMKVFSNFLACLSLDWFLGFCKILFLMLL